MERSQIVYVAAILVGAIIIAAAILAVGWQSGTNERILRVNGTYHAEHPSDLVLDIMVDFGNDGSYELHQVIQPTIQNLSVVVGNVFIPSYTATIDTVTFVSIKDISHFRITIQARNGDPILGTPLSYAATASGWDVIMGDATTKLSNVFSYHSIDLSMPGNIYLSGMWWINTQ